MLKYVKWYMYVGCLYIIYINIHSMFVSLLDNFWIFPGFCHAHWRNGIFKILHDFTKITKIQDPGSCPKTSGFFIEPIFSADPDA